MGGRRYPIDSLGIFIFKNNPANGAAMNVADGSPVFFLPGSDRQFTRGGPTFRTTSAIETACFNRPSRNIVSGASLTIQDCPICDPEMMACILNGYGLAYDDAGVPSCGVFEDPGEDCTPCGKTINSADSLTIIQFYCEKDCKDGDPIIKASGYRNVPKFDASAPKQIGGGDPLASSFDLTSSPQTAGDGWAFGPGNYFRLYDIDGNFDTSSGFHGCEIPPAQCLELAEFLNACDCALEYAACAITPEMIDAGIVPSLPMLTG